ncbi:glycoside hydrolase family 15 protein [Sulfoacidibacillus ferrooxidans]|uniref:GH15-like domain-containing protein n=1 Tax=Sulfoacidibacillus ferrooxidans TaxID=2005001 RepID=A0A9X1V9K5_9BACL|nr:glycoside hydrolase family 15 protein [Sulfoacidibacillus ferrooxidans]MCI0183764.1 hypothetical protein [Sulfoacidibacillus ferrooxidans]
MEEEALQVLEALVQPNGLYVASSTPDYRYVWIRDTCYVAFAYLQKKDGHYEQIYSTLLDLFKKYKWKIEYHAEKRPEATFEYIHPRYDPDRLEELHEPWGNAQNDAIGLFLFGIGEGLRVGKTMFRDESDREIVQLLAKYLVNLEFWQDADNGMWEEYAELHASSIGACVAGLMAISPYVLVDQTAVRYGMHALIDLLPRESATKECDLAQLSLIYPYQLLPMELSREIVAQVENQLLRQKGVIRYKGDQYFAEEGSEAQWGFGLPWLGLCYLIVGDVEKAHSYLLWTESIMPKPGILPELYLGQSGSPNQHTPLAWAEAMYVLLHEQVSEWRNKV